MRRFISSEPVRHDVIRVRVTDEEKALLRKLAASKGKSLAAMVRESVLGEAI